MSQPKPGWSLIDAVRLLNEGYTAEQVEHLTGFAAAHLSAQARAQAQAEVREQVRAEAPQPPPPPVR